MQNNSDRFGERLDMFLDAIRKYQNHELAIIQEKSRDEQEYEKNKILMEAQDQNESYFLKKQKTIEMDSKIARSRKINECRMSKMKLRH